MKSKKADEGAASETTWEGPGDRARQMMREYRALLSGYAAVPDPSKGKARKSAAARKAPVVSDLPAQMQELLRRYEREHPQTSTEPVAYITAGGHDASLSISAIPDLPREEESVILALTETVASVDRVEARSQVLLLRRLGKR